jgi:hypothetical protein
MKLKKFIKNIIKEILMGDDSLESEIKDSAYKEYAESGDMRKDLETAQRKISDGKDIDLDGEKERQDSELKNVAAQAAKKLPLDAKKSMEKIVKDLTS